MVVPIYLSTHSSAWAVCRQEYLPCGFNPVSLCACVRVCLVCGGFVERHWQYHWTYFLARQEMWRKETLCCSTTTTEKVSSVRWSNTKCREIAAVIPVWHRDRPGFTIAYHGFPRVCVLPRGGVVVRPSKPEIWWTPRCHQERGMEATSETPSRYHSTRALQTIADGLSCFSLCVSEFEESSPWDGFRSAGQGDAAGDAAASAAGAGGAVTLGEGG